MKEKKERWAEVENFFLSRQSFYLELIKDTLGSKKGAYGIFCKTLYQKSPMK